MARKIILEEQVKVDSLDGKLIMGYYLEIS